MTKPVRVIYLFDLIDIHGHRSQWVRYARLPIAPTAGMYVQLNDDVDAIDDPRQIESVHVTTRGSILCTFETQDWKSTSSHFAGEPDQWWESQLRYQTRGFFEWSPARGKWPEQHL